jgi:Domain of unknown function (DUF4115)
VLVGGAVGLVVVVGVIAAVIVRQHSHDDVHSVEHYHQQLHTLEEMRTHPSPGSEDGNGEAAYPASTFRVSGSSAVRLTEPGHALIPPVPPPALPNPTEPVTFDDDDGPEPIPGSFMTGGRDKAMDGINHRPRRLGGPIAAIVVVVVLVVVLIVTGLHSNSPKHHDKSATTPTTHAAHATHAHATHPTSPSGHHRTSTTTTTSPPAVSAPQAVSAHAATYQVSSSNYSLVLAATNGECWVEATNTATGSVLFTTTLFSGQSHAIPATSSVTVIAGAPGAFAATINGAAVTLPLGNQAPFTLHFVTVGSGGTTVPGGTGGTAGSSGSAATSTSTP